MKEFIKDGDEGVRKCDANISKMSIREYIKYIPSFYEKFVPCFDMRIVEALVEALTFILKGFMCVLWVIAYIVVFVSQICFLPIVYQHLKAIYIIKRAKKRVKEEQYNRNVRIRNKNYSPK